MRYINYAIMLAKMARNTLRLKLFAAESAAKLKLERKQMDAIERLVRLEQKSIEILPVPTNDPFPHGNSYVYVIQNTETGRIKIGKGNPACRLNLFQTGNDCELQIVAYWHHTYALAVEKSLHTTLGRYRVRGEWFSADALPLVREMMGK